MLQTDAEEPEAGLTGPVSPRFGHDFSRIPTHPPAAGAIQTKLAINEPRDEYEQEADRIAEQVMRTPEPQLQSACACGGGCPKCHTEQPAREHESLQTKRVQTSDTGQTTAPPTVHEVLASPGQPLDPATRAFMEPRFGYDFSRVRVHSGAAAEQSAQDVNAIAYTVGHNIVFGAGRFVPGTRTGQRLLAHELAHVVQQSGADAHLMHPLIPGGMVSPGQPPSRVAGVLALQHAAGDRAVSTILQRTPGPDTPAPPELKVRERVEAFRRGMTRAQELRRVADRLIEQELGSAPTRGLGARRNGLAEIARRGGPQADTARRLGGALAEIEADLDRRAAAVSSVADDLIERRLGARPKTARARESALGQLGEQSAGLQRELNEIEQELIERRPRPLQTSRFAEVEQVTAKSEKAAGKIGEAATKAEKSAAKTPPKEPPVKPPTTVPEPVPETVPGVKGPGVPPVGRSAVRVAFTGIALNVLLFAVSYYLEKWHAEKQVRKFNSDLKGLLPEVNARLKTKEAEIVEKEKAFPLVYGNITIVYTHDKSAPEDYNEGSMRIQDVAISHQNYQTPERLIKAYDPLSGNDPSYSLTFSVPLFEEKTAEKGASSLVRDYRQERENLTNPAFKVRLSAVIALYKLAEQDSSLETLVVRDLLGMLKDEHATVRLSAAVFLSRLKAKIGIQYIREVIPITGDDKRKELMQRYLHELEQG
ncbi:MAG: DUF4157 domain-containing protein [Ardenticatenaceae bacterium]|nr:DUF4157 domain-containing protein [Ardenticatenaceae bacterium]